MHTYRTHMCGELRSNHVDQKVKISGWLHRRRDHGNLLFVDIRDSSGLLQCVFNDVNPYLEEASHIRYESVVTIEGTIVMRSDDTINDKLPTGSVELMVDKIHVENAADNIPLIVNTDSTYPEDIRLKYRFLDLRREKMRDNIILRSHIISYLRQTMSHKGFIEFQTPILTASSPEGARDYLVPSRVHKGKFYALPQAPQQFKQLLMVSGFDKYFQIAPCFRDEDSRADRSPGEFYQLDIEMSFVTQEDIFATIEPLLYDLFTKFGNKKITQSPFPRITYDDAMLYYGSDKPDLRNPIKLCDTTEIFRDSGFSIFAKNITKGCIVRAIPAPGASTNPRSFFDKMIGFAQEIGASGLGYIIFDEDKNAKGPIAKLLTKEQLENIMLETKVQPGDSVFFTCEKQDEAERIAGIVRDRLGEQLKLIDETQFAFCWIVDYPYYERNKDTGKIEFSHNPFSMPQGGIAALENANSEEDLLKIKAYQYDIVCNGIELSSGAIRNHLPDLMLKAFEIVGYDEEHVKAKFGALFEAFRFGAPPHGGIAPGIDRMVMMLTDEKNIREVVCFPMNQQAQDLMMQAPSDVDAQQLKELGLKLSAITKK